MRAKPLAVIARAIGEARGPHAVLHQPLEVHVGSYQLLLRREALAFGEQLGVLVDQRLAIPGEVGRGLAGACGDVDMRRDLRPECEAHSSRR